MVVLAPFCDYRKNLHCILNMGQCLWHVNGISINLFVFFKSLKTTLSGTSLAVQWLRLHLVKELKVLCAARCDQKHKKTYCQPSSCQFQRPLSPPPLLLDFSAAWQLPITSSCLSWHHPVGLSSVTHHTCSVSFAGSATSLWMLEGPRLCIGPSDHLYWYFIPFGVYSISHKFILFY